MIRSDASLEFMVILKLKEETLTGRWSFEEGEVETRERSCRDIRPVKTVRDLTRSLSFLNYVPYVIQQFVVVIFHIS